MIEVCVPQQRSAICIACNYGLESEDVQRLQKSIQLAAAGSGIDCNQVTIDFLVVVV